MVKAFTRNRSVKPLADNVEVEPRKDPEEFRKFTTRLSPDNRKALKTAAVEADTTTQNVVNGLIRFGLVEGNFDLSRLEGE